MHDGTSHGPRPTLLMTGAAGRVGTAVRPYLRERFDLVLFDRVAPIDPRPDERIVVGDLADRDDVAAACHGADAVLHLACVHGLGLTLDASIDANVRGTMHLLEATHRAGIERFTYASSHHVHGTHQRAGFEGDAATFAPDGIYGLGKAFGELACTLYARRFGLRVAIVRIGNADVTVADDRALRLWTSARDLAALFLLCLTHPDVELDVVYGLSDCPDPLYRNDRARRLGYEPVDRALDHLSPHFLGYAGMPDHLGRDFVGGAYAVAPLAVAEEAR